ncbi:MAG: MMPL family transporter, partial [Saprospiraceae bacterium]|nr:MMPL family transporter [Saprospiraceae bacterium]
MMRFIKYPKTVIFSIIILSVLGVFLAITRVEFRFDLEDFFPKGDPDLAFFNEFKEKFEPDDNFLMIAISREEGVFDQSFLKEVERFSKDFRRVHFSVKKLIAQDTFDNQVYRYHQEEGKTDSVLHIHPIVSVQSVLQVQYPQWVPIMGFTTVPAIHIDEPDKYEADRERILADERFVNSLISTDGKTLVLTAKTHTETTQEVAKKLIYTLHDILDNQYDFEEYHILGPANFQVRLVEIQIYEFLFSTIVSMILILIVMFLIFRRFWGIFVAVISIGIGLILFVGALGLLGRELDTMAMLYPIIMIIVGTSDVVHVMSKYVDELKRGREKFEAIQITIREIGMSIFLTSATTAIGFLSLITSRVVPIQKFGVNAALGVMIAYVSVMTFTTVMLALFRKEQIMKLDNRREIWGGFMHWIHNLTRKYPKPIVLGGAILIAVCSVGISLVTTNNRLGDMLPRGEKVTEDFQFFEQQLSGFRPLEVAVELQGDYKVSDYKVMQEMAKLEDYLSSREEIQSVLSITTLDRSLNQAFNGDLMEEYKLPPTEKKFKKYRKKAKRLFKDNAMTGRMISKDGRYTRISARVLDVGADSIRSVVGTIDNWIAANIDDSVVRFRQTGTGVIVDRNSIYMRDSLLQGLGFAILVISILMALLYRNLKMVLVALIPNILPLMIAGALLGFTGIALEAGVAIVFA